MLASDKGFSKWSILVFILGFYLLLLLHLVSRVRQFCNFQNQITLAGIWNFLFSNTSTERTALLAVPPAARAGPGLLLATTATRASQWLAAGRWSAA